MLHGIEADRSPRDGVALIPIQIVGMGVRDAFVPSVIQQAIHEPAVPAVSEHIDVAEAPVIHQRGRCHFDNNGRGEGDIFAIRTSGIANDKSCPALVIRPLRKWLRTKYCHDVKNPCGGLSVITIAGLETNLRKSLGAERRYGCLTNYIAEQPCRATSSENISPLQVLLAFENFGLAATNFAQFNGEPSDGDGSDSSSQCAPMIDRSSEPPNRIDEYVVAITIFGGISYLTNLAFKREILMRPTSEAKLHRG